MKNLIVLIYVLMSFEGLCQELYFPPTFGTVWETVSPEDLGWCQEKLPELEDFMDVTNTKALIILKDGKVVVESYYNGFEADSLWYWASAGK